MKHQRNHRGTVALLLLYGVITMGLSAGCTSRGEQIIDAEPLGDRQPVLVKNLPSMPAEGSEEPGATPPSNPTEPSPNFTTTLNWEQVPVTATARPGMSWAEVDPRGQTVIFWHPFTYSRKDTLLEIVQKFNRTNEWDITVKAEYQGDFYELYQNTMEVLNTPAEPNLVLAYQDQAGMYQQVEALADMDSLVKDPTWGFPASERQDFFPDIWAQDRLPDGGSPRTGLPAYRAMDVMYYNADWLAELEAAGRVDFAGPPLTPQQFRTAACAAVEQPYSNAKDEGSLGYELSLSASRFASWAFAYGGELYDAQNNRYSFDSPPVVEAMQFIQDIFLSGCAEFVTESYSDQDDFGEGQLLFTVGTSSGLPFYQEAVDDGARFDWGVSALPHTTAEPAQNIYGPSLSLLRTTPEGELASWLFLKYFTSPQAQSAWAAASNYYPVRSSAETELGELFKSNPLYKTVFDLLPYGKYEPAVPGYESVRELVSEALRAMAEGTEVTNTLQKLNEEANTILEEQNSIAVATP